MGSPGRDLAERPGLWSRELVLLVWFPITLIGLLHFATPPHVRWAHDVLRRLPYLPIVYAALRLGLLGGGVAALWSAATYVPHAFLHPVHFDPGHGSEKALEIVLYFVVGAVAGHLADRERRRREQLRLALAERERLTDQLVRAGRLGALGEVVAGIAHEVKNPLHSLAGTAEVIDPLIPADAEERPLWEIHREEITRLGRVAERFLSFARPGELQLADQDLREVAERLVELVRAEASQKGVSLELDLPEIPCPVRADRDLLAQVGMNIALNGLRALEDGGRLRVSVGRGKRAEQPTYFLRLENDGPALPEEALERIFDPFHSGEPGGTGLGLAISARIAEQHDGFIEAANAGLGVRFTVHLPVASAAP